MYTASSYCMCKSSCQVCLLFSETAPQRHLMEMFMLSQQYRFSLLPVPTSSGMGKSKSELYSQVKGLMCPKRHFESLE